jgi:small GTP-binding protein
MLPRIARRGSLFPTHTVRRSLLLRSRSRSKRSAPRFSTTSQESHNPEEYGLFSLLNDAERQYLQEQREITRLSQSLASRVGIATVHSQSKSLLDELSTFSVVVAGEFNAGKSTLINALLGKKIMESGALPTTDAITIVSHADNESMEVPMGVAMHTSSLPLLEDLTLVDTPGTNSAWMDHTERTLNLLPAADLILFITSADRPFSESEKTLLAQIQAYRKHIVVVVNKMDILDTAGGDHGKEQKQAIVDFVTDHASELLGARPIVLAVSSRDALSAKLLQKPSSDDHDPQQRSNIWHRSNFQALENFLQTTLTTEAKLKSKLISPIGVAEGVVAQCLKALKGQRSELEADIATLNILQAQFEGWRKEMSADLDQSRHSMTETVREEGDRSEILLGRMNLFQFHAWALWNTQQLEQEWEETKRQASPHRQKSLETDLLEQVQETA